MTSPRTDSKAEVVFAGKTEDFLSDDKKLSILYHFKKAERLCEEAKKYEDEKNIPEAIKKYIEASKVDPQNMRAVGGIMRTRKGPADKDLFLKKMEQQKRLYKSISIQNNYAAVPDLGECVYRGYHQIEEHLRNAEIEIAVNEHKRLLGMLESYAVPKEIVLEKDRLIKEEKQHMAGFLYGFGQKNAEDCPNVAMECYAYASLIFPYAPCFLAHMEGAFSHYQKKKDVGSIVYTLSDLEGLHTLQHEFIFDAKHEAKRKSIAKAFVEYARELNEDRNYAEAIRFLERCTKIFLLDYRFDVELGVAKLGLEQTAEAIKHFEAANALNPKNERVNQYLTSLKPKPITVATALIDEDIEITAVPKVSAFKAKFPQKKSKSKPTPVIDPLEAETKKVLQQKAEQERLEAKALQAQILPFRKGAQPSGKKDPSVVSQSHSQNKKSKNKRHKEKEQPRSIPAVVLTDANEEETTATEPVVQAPHAVPIKAGATKRTWNPLPKPTLFLAPTAAAEIPAQIKKDEKVLVNEVKQQPVIKSPGFILEAVYLSILVDKPVPEKLMLEIKEHKKFLTSFKHAEELNQHLSRALKNIDIQVYLKKLIELDLLSSLFPDMDEKIQHKMLFIVDAVRSRRPVTLEFVFATLVIATAKQCSQLDENTIRRIVKDNMLIDHHFSKKSVVEKLPELYGKLTDRYDSMEKKKPSVAAPIATFVAPAPALMPMRHFMWQQTSTGAVAIVEYTPQPTLTMLKP